MQSRLQASDGSHRTYTGRIVYNRKVHFFKWSDVERILGKFVEQDDSWMQTAADFLDRINQKLWGILFERFGLQEISGMAYDFLTRIIQFFVLKIGDLFGADLRRQFKRNLVSFLDDLVDDDDNEFV